MRVRCFPADAFGCGSYRLIWPVTALQQQGHDVHLHLHQEPQRIWNEAQDADVVVLQRPMNCNMVPLAASLQQAGKAVVVEVDDDFRHLHPRNAAYKNTDPALHPYTNRDNLDVLTAVADLVTVTTPELAKVYGPHGRSIVLPNYVPARYLAIPSEEHDPLRLTWPGSLAYHPDDLQTTGGVLRQIIREHPEVVFVGLGDPGMVRNLGLKFGPRVGVTQGVIIDEYPAALAERDVLMAPLAGAGFNDAKSWLKPLEAAALGLFPIVAKTCPDYRRLRPVGITLEFAGYSSEWGRALRRVITDHEYRREAVGRNREVCKGMTIEGNAWRWMEAWQHAYATRGQHLFAAAA